MPNMEKVAQKRKYKAKSHKHRTRPGKPRDNKAALHIQSQNAPMDPIKQGKNKIPKQSRINTPRIKAQYIYFTLKAVFTMGMIISHMQHKTA